MAWWDQFMPWAAPLYTRPPVPEYFNPPKVNGMDYDWSEGLPEDVVRRNMPPSSVPWGQSYADQLRQSQELSRPPVMAPPVPEMPNLRGPMQATDASSPTLMQTERFGMPSPYTGTTTGPVPPPFPSTPPMNAERASRAPMGVFDPRNTPGSVGTADVAGLKTSFSSEEFKNRLLVRGEASHLVPDSDGGTRAVSPKGAKGIAQFMDGTWDAVGKMMGRPADAPGPFDKAESLLRYNYYMDHLLKKYGGNQVDVAVAYNAGEGFANKWIRAGRPQDMLPGETRRYIANIFGGKPSQYALAGPDTASSEAPPESPRVPASLRSPAAAPSPGEQAPRRPPFDWGPDANIWQMAMGMGQGLMKPTPYGTMGAVQQGFEGATQAAQSGQDRALKRELLKAQVGEAKSKSTMRDWAKAIYADTSIPAPIRMAALFKPESIPELMKDLDPATREKLAQYAAMTEGAKARAEAQAKMDVGKEATRESSLQSATLVTQAIDKALKQSESGWTTGMPGTVMRQLPGTAARDLSATVDTIKANVGFDKLQAMRQASPTGGALGPVSDFENKLLQSVVASLETSQSKEQFRENLMKVKRIYDDIIHKGIRPGEENRYMAAAPSTGWTDAGDGWKVRAK